MRKKSFLVIILALVVLLAGCGGVIDDGQTDSIDDSVDTTDVEDADVEPSDSTDGPEFTSETQAELYESHIVTLDDDNRSAVESAIFEDGEVHESGETFLAYVADIEQLGDEPTEGILASVAKQEEIPENMLIALDRLINSPEAFQEDVFSAGVTDSTNSGITDGEKETFGLDPTDEYDDFVEVAINLGSEGYTDTDITYLARLSELSTSEWAQATYISSIELVIERGETDAAIIENISDESDDELLNGFADEVGLDPSESYKEIGRLTAPLATKGLNQTDVRYVETVATSAEDDFIWEQAHSSGLLNSAVADERVDNDTIAGFTDSSGDGLIDAKAEKLGLDPQETHDPIADLAKPLASDGFDDGDIDYLTQAAVLAEDDFTWKQAEYFGLLEDEAADGEISRDTLSEMDIEEARLLSVTAEEIELWNQPNAAPKVEELAEPLAQDGFSNRDIQYLERIVYLYQYEQHPYEGWAQAEELGLLHDVVGDGEIHEDELWAINNDASNRLLNGMEVEFGTDPNKADTSGDGYEDHIKWGPLQDLGFDVTPDEPDVYIELEADQEADLPSTSQQSAIVDLFADEPADHTGTINVHFYEFRTDVEPVTEDGQISDRMSERNLDGIGAHYLLRTDDPFYLNGEEVGGAARWSSFGPSWMVAVDSWSTDWQTATIAHEKGHAFGIGSNDFDGVDSTEYTASEYNSVMNYNIQGDHSPGLTFNIGGPFDDYEHMFEQEFNSDYQDHSYLDTIWNEGDVPEAIV